MNSDRYFVLADFNAFAAAQQEAGKAGADISRWATMSLLNTARSGKFSFDRTIREYCEDIWKLPLGDCQPQSQRSSLQKSTVKVKGMAVGREHAALLRHTLCNPHLGEISIAHRPVVIRTIDRDWTVYVVGCCVSTSACSRKSDGAS